MATATAMYHTGFNPLQRLKRNSDKIGTVKRLSQRRLHKAFLRYHDPENWPLLRKTLKQMGRRDLIGNGAMHLIPARQPPKRHRVVKAEGRTFRTQHSGEQKGAAGDSAENDPLGINKPAINSPNWRNSTLLGVFLRHIRPILRVTLVWSNDLTVSAASPTIPALTAMPGSSVTPISFATICTMVARLVA